MNFTPRERLVRTVLGQPVDRVPFYLFWGPWGDTWRRWEKEGKPASLNNWDAIRQHFQADPPGHVVNILAGPCPRFESKIIERAADSYVHIDSWGIIRRNFSTHEGMSEFLRFPVQSREDWETYKRERLDPHHPDRLPPNWRDGCRAAMEQGRHLQLGNFPDVGLFGGLRWLLGDEECLVAFHESPDLVHEIMSHLTTVYLTVFEQVVREFPCDQIHLWEDMCSRNGPLISPAHFNEFMAPNYRRIKDFARKHNIPLLSLDTDGDCTLLTQPMIDAGINLMLPFEVAAGCDVNVFRKKYPTLGMLGGVDKRQLAKDHAAIDAEIARITPALRAGRYIPELDHLVPSDVSWENFAYYATRIRATITGSK